MSLKEHYIKNVIPAMREKFQYKNILAVPKIEKVVINVGIGLGMKDKINVIENTLTRITGQKPVKTLAKKSISNFKIRQGAVIGMMVTLRGNKMYDFIDKLINIVLPRLRDFHGLIEKSIDKGGNFNLGFREHNVFSEINPDEIESLHGLEVTIVTTAKDKKEGLEFLKLLGFLFKKEKTKS
ncbi:50S ribosomal protein L5 [Candidatus Kuenenbacteria bacterium HGW-Kuenenbacteria-1]|uniref:Large ribosomal subunit protein uL5 n=1 Tax=Candidatus Kuenenbacteria bacterium HGW-Kuenenbacteria-1 TaxID=2013812 RepID=A0A2N1UNE0_9BACT|nr:MAG: 50S ribosomal protein L5 [Candidatus Kuenenbacteria bacterium HGW-Kuenenbacteria-1]